MAARNAILQTHALSADPEVAPQSANSKVPPARDPRPLGQILLDDGAVTAENITRALVMRRNAATPLGQILLTHGWVDEDALTRALAKQWRICVIDLARNPPDPRLIDHFGVERCLAGGFVPWRRLGGVTYIATSRPDEFGDQPLPSDIGQVHMVFCPESSIRNAIVATRRTSLIRRAETRTPEAQSCRGGRRAMMGRITLALVALMIAGLITVPQETLTVLTLWAVLTLIATMGLKLAAFINVLRPKGDIAPPVDAGEHELPVISVMIPLFGEADIADRLLKRLSRLSYPRELTDLLLVVEEGDKVTSETLAKVALPNWIRVIKVPDGPIKTKPRALNYAFNFCRGRIVGIWDAEDRPEPTQLHKVAQHFHTAPPDVACVQGILDYYNPRTNWLARCFTIEYAAWFRANLKGIARMGLVVPLGGTTLFFRRDILENLGCWDAWNVTEDADLGVRLARAGYRTEMIDTVTHEEANCRALPWIKQRSRWLKGYAMTWAVHMRNPALLLRQLGARRFIGFQIQFLGAISQYLLAPVMWSFWLLPFGLPHPLRAPLTEMWGGAAITVLIAFFIASELLNVVVGLWAVRGTSHRHLMPWVPTLHFYFPLGCLAGWKAIYEVIAKPFFWDKTAHGIYDCSEEGAAETPPNSTSRLTVVGRIS